MGISRPSLVASDQARQRAAGDRAREARVLAQPADGVLVPAAAERHVDAHRVAVARRARRRGRAARRAASGTRRRRGPGRRPSRAPSPARSGRRRASRWRGTRRSRAAARAPPPRRRAPRRTPAAPRPAARRRCPCRCARAAPARPARRCRRASGAASPAARSRGSRGRSRAARGRRPGCRSSWRSPPCRSRRSCPCAAACSAMPPIRSRHASRSIFSPRPVGFTLTSPSSRLLARSRRAPRCRRRGSPRRRRARRSPRPARRSSRACPRRSGGGVVSTASASVSPAMYGAANRRTSGRGISGTPRASRWSIADISPVRSRSAGRGGSTRSTSPGYRRASVRPAAWSASRSTQAVTPEPQ